MFSLTHLDFIDSLNETYIITSLPSKLSLVSQSGVAVTVAGQTFSSNDTTFIFSGLGSDLFTFQVFYAIY